MTVYAKTKASSRSVPAQMVYTHVIQAKTASTPLPAQSCKFLGQALEQPSCSSKSRGKKKSYKHLPSFLLRPARRMSVDNFHPDLFPVKPKAISTSEAASAEPTLH